MVRRDVIEITGMDQDSIRPQQLRCRLFLIASDPYSYVEAALRLSECDPFQPFDSSGSASLYPLFVFLQKAVSPAKNFRYCKLRDLVHRQKCVRDQIESGR